MEQQNLLLDVLVVGGLSKRSLGCHWDVWRSMRSCEASKVLSEF